MNQLQLTAALIAMVFLSCNRPASNNSTMQQRLSIITIGANDLQALRAFYTDKFGWQTVAANKDIVFFKLNGFLLGLYGSKELAKFAVKDNAPTGYKGFTLSYMVDSKEEVEELYTRFKEKDIHILQTPSVPPIGGYYFMAEDIEGNVWEVACNPFIPLDKTGNVITHQPIDHL